MKPTPFQEQVLSIPEQWNILLAGGRGGGKSVAIQLLVLRHCTKYADKARVLIVRQSYKGSSDFESSLASLFRKAFGKGVRHNLAEHTFRLPNGAQVEIGQLNMSSDYDKYQGHSYTLLVLDEYGTLTTTKFVSMLKSNMRAEPGIPLQEIRAANPGGMQHAQLHHKFILASPPGVPFKVQGKTWVWLSSTLRDNPHIDREKYVEELQSLSLEIGDPDLARAWIDGDWNIARGAMFAGVLDDKVHRISIKPTDPRFDIFSFTRFIALDWGTSAPSVVYLCLRSHGEGGGPPGSLILLDEIATCRSMEDLNEGLKWPPGKLAEAIHDMCEMWGLRNVPHGIGDDCVGLDESLLEYFRREGIWLDKPNKTRGSRVSGWAKMRELFHNAKELNGKPGMWVNDRCKYFWATLPFLPRDPDRPEDIMSNGPDHAADAARYAVLKNAGNSVSFGTTCGG